jgi:glycine oxidase
LTKHFNFIIIGQGLAGTVLTFFLEMAGKSVLVIDHSDPSSSSHIAAGIIHPITGRRIVKSWRVDEMLPFAENTYRLMSEKFQRNFYHQKNIVEIYTSVKHRNDWLARSSEDQMKLYSGNEMNPGEITGVRMPLGGMLIRQSGFLLIHDLVSCYEGYLKNKNQLLHENFNYEDLGFTDEIISWKNITADEIIFCEGAVGRLNPFFKWLPFIPSKGEILTISAPLLEEKFILNKGLYILPLGNHIFKAGATNEWNELNNIPTIEALNKMKRILSEIIQSPFEIIKHEAAVRPTVKDRRPFCGKHPLYKRINIFNGLGTKGVLLAPYCAQQLTGLLANKKSPDPEIDISRFHEFFNARSLSSNGG